MNTPNVIVIVIIFKQFSRKFRFRRFPMSEKIALDLSAAIVAPLQQRITFNLIILLIVSSFSFAQQFNPNLYQNMRWRMIGPFRAGRTVGAVGIPSQPNVFYIGVNNGGVWKTTDAGRTWHPIFDDQPTGSIGWVAVAPSDPNIIYVGSGEGLPRPDLSTGDGIYRSNDAGQTWTHLGLRDAQQIPKIAVD